jgi:hypothetical protein
MGSIDQPHCALPRFNRRSYSAKYDCFFDFLCNGLHTHAPHHVKKSSSLTLASTMATKIPPLLGPYLADPPEASLILVTGVLGASPNWLTLRYLYSLLKAPAASSATSSLDDGIPSNADETGVILLSFMRDFGFWKDGAGRLVGRPFAGERRMLQTKTSYRVWILNTSRGREDSSLWMDYVHSLRPGLDKRQVASLCQSQTPLPWCR